MRMNGRLWSVSRSGWIFSFRPKTASGRSARRVRSIERRCPSSTNQSAPRPVLGPIVTVWTATVPPQTQTTVPRVFSVHRDTAYLLPGGGGYLHNRGCRGISRTKDAIYGVAFRVNWEFFLLKVGSPNLQMRAVWAIGILKVLRPVNLFS